MVNRPDSSRLSIAVALSGKDGAIGWGIVTPPGKSWFRVPPAERETVFEILKS